MERMLAAVLTGLWIAPLMFLAVSALWGILYPTTSGSDRAMASGILMILVAGVAALAGLVAGFFVISLLAPASMIRTLLLVSGGVVAAMAVGAFVMYQSGAQRRAPRYEGFMASLDVEVRAPLTNKGRPRILVDLGDGRAFGTEHPEADRDEGNMAVFAKEFQVIQLHSWAISVMDEQADFSVKRYWFDLDLPERPAASGWSGWQASARKDGYEAPGRVELRYRFVLTPAGAARVWAR